MIRIIMKISMLGTTARSVRCQAGDTIVEVVIAITVVSSVLTGAFIVTNNSTKGVRDAEEHAQALQLVQGQVELLRAAASHSGGLPTDLSAPFCLDVSGYYPTTNSHCTVNNIYLLSIQSPTAAAVPNATTVFNLTTTWPSLKGGTAQVALAYKTQVTP